MPYNEEKKLIFVHIPKTAGSSIEHSLFEMDTTSPNRDRSRPDVLFGIIPRSARYRYGFWKEREWQHLTALQIRRVLGKEIWSESKKFSVVRNPWDRMISFYHYLNRQEPFKEWVKSLNTSGTHISKTRLIKNQCQWLYDRKGRCLVDRIMRFETMQDDYSDFTKQFANIELPPLPHIRKSERGRYQDYYDSSTRQIVETIYKEDVSIFNYTF